MMDEPEVESAQPRGGPSTRRPTILVLTASMGAGHTGVASELARRLDARGYQAKVVDLLEILPSPLGAGLRSLYAVMLRRTPWIYEAIYRVWFKPSRNKAAPVSPVTWFGARAVRRWVTDHHPVAAVSTFHLCSRILGNLRRAGQLSVPTATVVVDFAVHDLWVDPAVDLHVCLHPSMARQAQRRGATRTTAPGPIVRSCFRDSVWDRQSARASLDLGDGERAVLIVAGSWGAGDLDAAVDSLGKAPGITGLVVCGSDEKLRRRLAGRRAGVGEARIMGWVPDMDRLMLAADVVVENAGGLTCMEALAVGRPVVSFNPIPGHGRANIEAMADCGIVEYVPKAQDLVTAVQAAAGSLSQPNPRSQAAAAMFRGDAADDILTILASDQPVLLSS